MSSKSLFELATQDPIELEVEARSSYQNSGERKKLEPDKDSRNFADHTTKS